MADTKSVHDFKILSFPYEAIMGGIRTFAIQKTDRIVEVGDSFVLREVKKGHGLSGKYALGTILNIDDFKEDNNYLICSFQLECYSCGKLPFKTKEDN